MQDIKFDVSAEVSAALADGRPVVALESTVVAHGLPYPTNLEIAREMENAVSAAGAVPATIAVFGGTVKIGLSADDLERLAAGGSFRKISMRDVAIALAQKLDCATTVATTAFFAHRAGIKFFATGGIGGVHRGDGRDISADLPVLASTPITIVCSGAKSILDMPATREWLETAGVPVLGWQTDEFPAFYVKNSGLPVDERVDDAAAAADIVAARDKMALPQTVLITVPVPDAAALSADEVESTIAAALQEAERSSITGKAITPFLLAEMAKRSGGRSMAANTALLVNNARIAGLIAAAAANGRP